jgi:hypothetical protein
MLSGFDCSAPLGLAAPRSGKARVTEPSPLCSTTINTALPPSLLLRPFPTHRSLACLSLSSLTRPKSCAARFLLLYPPLPSPKLSCSVSPTYRPLPALMLHCQAKWDTGVGGHRGFTVEEDLSGLPNFRRVYLRAYTSTVDVAIDVD